MGKIQISDIPSKLIYNKKKEIYDAFILNCRKEVEEEIASENEVKKLEAQAKLRCHIAEANKALPSNKINGGEFQEDRLEIDYIIALDNTIPSMADTRSSGLYFETRHLWESMNKQIQKKRNPQLKVIPVSWNDDYKDNNIPFLPQCPVCSKQNTILFKSYGGQNGSPCYYTNEIDTVQCFPHASDYKWDSNTKKHLKRVDDINAHLKEWDPTDPDGLKLEAEKKKKEVEVIQQQISELQCRYAELQIR